MPNEHLLTPKDLSTMLGIPLSTLYNWRYTGYGPPALKIGRHLRYRLTDITCWLETKADQTDNQ